MAHLGTEAFDAIGRASNSTTVRLYLDVIQAFTNIVVAFTLPLGERMEDARNPLEEIGLSPSEIETAVAEARSPPEWNETPEHLRQVIAAYQKDQWVATDHAPGILHCAVGASAGVPLAGVVACANLSRVTCRTGEDGKRRLESAFRSHRGQS